MAKLSLQGLALPFLPAQTGSSLFNLDVEEKELLVLAGPCGSGKTCLLRIISGLDCVSRGDLFIEGKKAMEVGKREIALVFSEGGLFEAKTVHENLAFGLKTRRVPAGEMKRRIEEAASILGLQEILSRRVESLGMLERKKVALGRAMVRQPKAFLLDEPLQGLDPVARKLFQTELVHLQERLQATMIYATADPVQALAVATRVVVLKEGIIQQDASPAAIYQNPANLFVAEYFGNPGMNLVRGKLKEAGDQVQFRESGEGTIQCSLPASWTAARQFLGKEVVLGVRPEQILPVLEESAASAKPVRPLIKGLVESIESHGAESMVHIQTGAHLLWSRSPGFVDRSHAGHRMQFELDLTHACLFDPESGLRISIAP